MADAGRQRPMGACPRFGSCPRHDPRWRARAGCRCACVDEARATLGAIPAQPRECRGFRDSWVRLSCRRRRGPCAYTGGQPPLAADFSCFACDRRRHLDGFTLGDSRHRPIRAIWRHVGGEAADGTAASRVGHRLLGAVMAGAPARGRSSCRLASHHRDGRLAVLQCAAARGFRIREGTCRGE